MTVSVPRYALPLVGAQFACFLGVGATLPVLPLHLVGPLDASGLVLGAVLGVYPLASLVGRFVAGAAADRRGRGATLVTGLLLCSAAGFLLLLPLNAAALAGARSLHGLGQAVVAVAAVTWLMDITEPARRAESLALIGAGVWGGTTLGTLVGGSVGSLGAAGMVAGVAALAGLPALRWARRAPAMAGRGGSRALIPRAALVPGLTFGLGSVGYAAVIGFVVLHLDGRGGSGTAALSAFSAAVLLGRFVVVPPVVRFGLLRSLRPALVVTGLGLLAVASSASTLPGVLGVVLVALGHSVLWPALGALVTGRVLEEQRGAAIGSMTAFYDVFVGGSTLLFGVMAVGLGTGSIFVAAAGAVLAAALFDACFGRAARAEAGARAADPEPVP